VRALAVFLVTAGFCAAPVLVQAAPSEHHQHHHQLQHHTAVPGAGRNSHNQELGPAGATYDQRWLDAMVQHHTGALRVGE
jgi:uncharacterized protein (DUF305 family)